MQILESEHLQRRSHGEIAELMLAKLKAKVKWDHSQHTVHTQHTSFIPFKRMDLFANLFQFLFTS